MKGTRARTVRGGIAALAALLIACVCVTPAGAAPYGALRFFAEPGPPPATGDTIVGGCTALTLSESLGTHKCEQGRGLDGAFATAVSADGKHVYAAAPTSDAVVAYARDSASGRLSEVGCISHGGAGGCSAGSGLDGADAVAVSSDGKNVYVSARTADAVAVFARDPDSGRLTQLAGSAGCVSDGGLGGCTPARALDHAVGIALSPDGGRVYVAARGADAIAVFARSASGALTQDPGPAGCLQDRLSSTAASAGCTSARGLDGAFGITLFDGPEVDSLYVASRVSNAIAVLHAAPGGTLAQTDDPATPADEGCISQYTLGSCIRTGKALNGATAVAVSPDGANLYTTSYESYAVATFARDAATGQVTLLACRSEDREADRCTPSRGLLYATAVTVSPDGRNVYVAGGESSAIAIFQRGADGALAQEGPLEGASWSEGCISWRGHRWVGGNTDLSQPDHSDHYCARGLALYYPYSVTLSPDGRHLYVATQNANSVTALRRLADAVAPDLSIDSPDDGGATADSTPVLRGTAGTEDGDAETGRSADERKVTIELAPAGGQSQQLEALVDADGSWSAEPSTALADGEYAVTARQRDGAGNVATTPARTFTIDTAAPDTTITGAPAAISQESTASFAFAATEEGTTFECRIDGGGWEPCLSPRLYGGLSNGVHTFDVRATDLAGNLDESPASHAWTVADDSPPDTQITAGPSGATSGNPNASFMFTASEQPARLECRLDGGAWADCQSPREYRDLSDGAHAFEARARDDAGNTDPTPARRDWSIDTRPRATTGGSSNVGKYSATLAGTATANGRPSTYWFEYGRTTAYGSRTSESSAGAGTTGVAVSASLGGLTRRTTYHYRLVVRNAAGTAYGVDRWFATW